MGRLVEGRWTDEWYDTKSTGGRFVRQDSAFREWIRADGSTRFAPREGSLPPLRLARLPVGPPHADRPKAEGPRGPDQRLGRPSLHGRERLDVRQPGPPPTGVTGDALFEAAYLHEIYTRAEFDLHAGG